MKSSIYELILLTGTDFFSEIIFKSFNQNTSNLIKLLSRKYLKKILNGGDNFYLSADYQPKTINELKDGFFNDLAKIESSENIAFLLKNYLNIIDNYDTIERKASDKIAITTARLFWLNEGDLKLKITEELIEVMAEVEALNSDDENSDSQPEDICNQWLNSESEWDRYIMSILDGITDAPTNTFKNIQEFEEKLNYLRSWKLGIGIDKFAIIRDFIINEATMESHDKDMPIAIKNILYSI